MNPRDDERGLRVAAGGNRFAFVAMVRERAHDLSQGAAPNAYTESQKPVTIAIVEAAAGELGHRRTAAQPAATRASEFVVECRSCGEYATIRRKAGVEPRGRPPGRCGACGLGPNWEQVE